MDGGGDFQSPDADPAQGLYGPNWYEKARGKVGTLEEHLKGILGEKVGEPAWAAEEANEFAVGKAKYDPFVEEGRKLTGAKTWSFLRSFLGSGRAATISRFLRGIPALGKQFGVAVDRYPILVQAAEAIHSLKADGTPKFGTRELLRRGDTETWVQRYTEGEGKAFWDTLNREGEREAVLSWVDYRMAAEKLYDIATKQEGYFPRVWDEEGMRALGIDPGEMKGKGLLFREKVARERHMRKGWEGGEENNPISWDKDWEARVVGYKQGMALEKQWNHHVNEMVDIVGREWPKESQLPAGWGRVPMDIEGVPVVGGGKIMPQRLIERWVEGGKQAKELTGLSRLSKTTGDYVKTVVLSSVKTLMRNVVGGAAQYTVNMIEGMGKALVTGKPMKFLGPAMGPFEALLPSSWERLPPYALGSEGLFTLKGRGVMRRVGDTMLSAYGSVENYWKRSIAIGEMRARGLTPVAAEMEASQGLNRAVRGQMDAFGYDYRNIHPTLKAFRDHPFAWPLAMFPVFPYKSARLITRYLGALNMAEKMSVTDRLARILTLGTLVGAGVLWHKMRKQSLPDLQGWAGSEQEEGTVGLGIKDSVGEWRLDPRDMLGVAGDNALTPGPVFQVAKAAFGDEKLRGGRLGTLAGTLLVPGGRTARDIRKMDRAEEKQPERIPATFWEGAGQFLPVPAAPARTGQKMQTGDEFSTKLEGMTGLKVTRSNAHARMVSWLSAWRKAYDKAKTGEEKAELLRKLMQVQNANRGSGR